MARGNQIIRQWRILRLLEHSRLGLRAREVHDQLEGSVTERTIFRDLRDLEAAGFPLWENDGRWGVSTADRGGYSIPVQTTELLALLLSEELMAPLGSAEVVSALGGLRDKVTALLSPAGREYAEELKEHLIATFVGPGDYTDNDVVCTIEEAIHQQHRVRILYWSPKGPETERAVDPYVMWYADARLYLVGWCGLRHAVRTFLVDRVRAIEILDETFEPDPTFDPRAFAGSGLGAWSGDRHRVEIEFTPPVAHLAHERRFHPTQQIAEAADHSVVLTMHVAGLPHVAAWIASFGGRVLARSPQKLVDMVRDIHRNGLAACGAPMPVDNPPD